MIRFFLWVIFWLLTLGLFEIKAAYRDGLKIHLKRAKLWGNK